MWDSKLAARLAAMGFETVGGFIEAFPGNSLVDLAKRAGERVSAVQLVVSYYREAQASGQLRAAAQETLSRSVIRFFPEGWHQEERSDFLRASAATFWWQGFKMADVFDQNELRLRSVWKELKALPPPPGWLPADGADPLIQKVFQVAWPE